MDARTEEIKWRVEKATPGPWKYNSDGGSGDPSWCYIIADNPQKPGTPYYVFDNRSTDADANFAAHARSDVPYLLTELTALREEVERLKGALDRIAALKRSSVATADMCIEIADAAALSPSPAQQEHVPKRD